MAEQLGLDQPSLVETLLQPLDDPIQQAAVTHLVEAVIDGLPGAIAAGQVTPGSTGLQAPEDAIEDGAVVPPLAATLPGPAWEEGGEQPPLVIGKIVPLHTKLDAPGPYFDSSDKAAKLVPCVRNTEACNAVWSICFGHIDLRVQGATVTPSSMLSCRRSGW